MVADLYGAIRKYRHKRTDRNTNTQIKIWLMHFVWARGRIQTTRACEVAIGMQSPALKITHSRIRTNDVTQIHGPHVTHQIQGQTLWWMIAGARVRVVRITAAKAPKYQRRCINEWSALEAPAMVTRARLSRCSDRSCSRPGSISGETKLSKARLLLTCPCAEASLLHYHQPPFVESPRESTRKALCGIFAFCGLDWRTQTTTKLALLACWLWSWSAFVRARMHPRLRLATTWENVCSSEFDGAHKVCTLICTPRLRGRASLHSRDPKANGPHGKTVATTPGLQQTLVEQKRHSYGPKCQL